MATQLRDNGFVVISGPATPGGSERLNMKLKTFALFAEIVSAIAVTVSLLFVGVQIQENTTASEAATFQASVTHDIDILTSAASSPDTARVFYAFRDHPDTLSGGELLQGQAMITALVRHVENLFLQHQAGMLSDEGWLARETFVRNLILSPGFQVLLNSPSGRNFSGAFLAYAERVRTEAAPTPSTDGKQVGDAPQSRASSE